MLEWNDIWHRSSLLFSLIEPTEQTNKLWTGTGTVYLYQFQIYLTFTMRPAGKKGEFSPCERMFVCQQKLAGDTYPNIRSKFMLRFGKQAPSRLSMQYMVEKLKTKHTVQDMRKGKCGRRKTVRSARVIASVKRSLERASSRKPCEHGPSARRNPQNLNKSSYNRITREDRKLKPYIILRVHIVSEE